MTTLKPIITEVAAREQAQAWLDQFTRSMADRQEGREVYMGSHPVEATHKSGFAEDRIPAEPCSSWGRGGDWYDHNLARCLVNAYFSKAAFIKLVWLLLRENRRLRDKLAEASR